MSTIEERVLERFARAPRMPGSRERHEATVALVGALRAANPDVPSRELSRMADEAIRTVMIDARLKQQKIQYR